MVMSSLYLLFLLSLTHSAAPSAAAELIRTPHGVLMTFTNAQVEEGWFRLAILDEEEVVFYYDWTHEFFRRWRVAPPSDQPDTRRLGGPIAWGAVENAMYFVMHARAPAQLSSWVTPAHRLTSTRID